MVSIKTKYAIAGLCAALSLSVTACDDDDSEASPTPDSGVTGGMGGAGGAGGTGGDVGGAGGMGGDGGAGGEACVVEGDERINIAGLEAPVKVRFDEQGVLHATCQSNEDCYRVQGYYHAAHRFNQMDIRRRLVRAQLSAVVGDPTLATDRSSRLFFSDPRTGDELALGFLESADETTLAALDAYSEGVNAWLADMRAGRNGARLSDEYEFPLINKEAINDWSREDSAACILALLNQLTNQTSTEIAYGAAYASLPAAISADLFSLRPGSLSAIQPTAEVPFDQVRFNQLPQRIQAVKDRLQPALPALRAASAKLPATDPHLEGLGSNNWVIGPDRSTNGHALLANDPHLGLSNPSVWYVIHMDAKSEGQGDLHVAGVSFAGLPNIILGQNETIAWGATTTYFDMADVYVETLTDDGNGVVFDGMDVPFVEREITLEVSGGEPFTETNLYVPHHGPVIEIDREAGIAISLRWVGHEAGGDLNFLTRMHKATTAEEAREALKTMTTVGQNWVVADTGGHIGWFPYNTVPNRPWASLELAPWVPLPGDGTAEWDGFLPYEALPQAYDPPAAYIATANNDMTGNSADGDPTNDGDPMLQHYLAFGARHGRIVEAIEAIGDQHSRATMNEILGDVRSYLGERATPYFIEAADNKGGELTEAGEKVADALKEWNFECPTGLQGVDPQSDKSDEGVDASIGCAAFHVTWPRLRRMTFSDDLPAGSLFPRDSAMFIALDRPMELSTDYWDDLTTPDEGETREDILIAAMNDAGAWLEENLGEEPDDWRWGRIHTVTLAADLFNDAGIRMFNNGPYANDGGLYTVDVANPSGMLSDDYSHGSGASMRFACDIDPASGPDCTLQIPGGQRHFRESEHYDDLLQKWLVNEPFPLLTKESLIDGATVERVGVCP